jgi:putative ABC transport system permease protein
MLRNYIRIALRNLRRHSFYTILNVFGLSLGIACALILYQFISWHLAFDTQHSKAQNIYKVVTELHLDDGSVQYEKGAPLALATAIKTEIPQIRTQAFLFHNYRDLPFTIAIPQSTHTTQQLFSEHGNVAFTDQHWFELFDYEWETGQQASSLEAPNTAVLTRKQANKYFGNADPIGRTIRINDKITATVTGILKDYPPETSTKVDIFLSAASMKGLYPDMFPAMETTWGWINSSNNLFLLLPDGVSADHLNKTLRTVTQRHMGEMAKYYHFHLEPLKDLHFDARFGGVISKSLLTTLSIIGLIILVIAAVNFINLATAQNVRRSKEISTRKVLGSSASSIFWQFMTETFCITLSATVLSLVWVAFALPILNPWLQTSLSLSPFAHPQLIIALISLVLFITLLSGSYPAFLLSRYKPVTLLKANQTSAGRPWMRKSLILFQNLVAQSLIICTLIITLQTRFMKTVSPGFDKAGVVMVPLPSADKNKLDYLRTRLMHTPGVKDVSFCFRPPASATFKAGSVKFDNREWENYTALCTLGDAHYLPTFGIQLLAGRNLLESDTASEFLINEYMMRQLGFRQPSEVIGHQLVAGTLDDRPGIIVGVVRDFNLHSMHSKMEPLIMTSQAKDYAYVGIKISGTGMMKSISSIKDNWQTLYPDNVFEYDFLDDQMAAFYKGEDLLNRLIGGAAILAISISCIGLLGLISLLTVQRTKEIGIRKVIGASVANIVLLLSGDLMKLVGIALVLAAGLSWLAMQYWLQGFAYRINIPWWVFVLAGMCNVALALMTIGYHAVKAAMMNPVKSLKVE